MTVLVELELNGARTALEVEPGEFLSETLRERLGLGGLKVACGMGECGACTVLLDGLAVFSCLTLAVETRGRRVTTVEGLARRDDLSPLQQRFAEQGAAQCGYCTPGMLISATALLGEKLALDEASIRRALAGNLCRCTGYAKIVEAVRAAAAAPR